MLPIWAFGPLPSPALTFDAAWTDGSVLRYAHPALIGPIEPGTNFEDGFPGRGLSRKPLGLGFESLSFPVTQDLLVARLLNGGGDGGGFPDASVTPRIGRVEVEGARHAVIIGANLTSGATASGFIYKALPGSGSCFLEGIVFDLLNGPEADVVGVTGPATGPGIRFWMQNCCGHNAHGTAQAHDAGRAVTSAEVFAGYMRIVCSTTAPSAITVGQEVSVGESSDVAFDSSWSVLAVNVGSIDVGPAGVPLPALGATSTGGTLWAYNAAVLGTHADIAQGYGAGAIIEMNVHLTDGTGNYDFVVVGQKLSDGLGAALTRISMCDYRHVDIHPQDNGGFCILAGDYDTVSGTVSARGARVANLEIYDTYHQGRANDDFANAIIPQAGRTVDGVPFGMRVGRRFGEVYGSYPAGNPVSSIRGVLYKGLRPGGPLVTPASINNGHDYVSIGYDGVAAPPATPRSITLTGTTYAADAPRGALIGLIGGDLDDGYVYDPSLTDDGGGYVQLAGRHLERGLIPHDGGSFDITLRLTNRQTGAWFEETITITCTAAVSPAYGAMSDADAVAFVRGLYSYDALTSGDLAFYDGLFAAWKAINGGAFYPKIKAWFAAAMLDERDAELNWVDPTNPGPRPVNYQKAWDANVGYVGNPVPDFHMTRAGFTADSLGLGQDDCAMMIMASIKAPGVADGTLPAGTEYFAGVTNVTSDGFGGLFIGTTATGQVSCKCSNDATKNTAATPFAGTGGTMRHVIVTRTASTGFVICHGPKGAALTIDTTTAATGASSASHPLTTYDMRLNGRGGATTNAGSRTLHATAFLLGVDHTTEADAFRAVNDTWLDYLGIA
jgi:hypothetical protein